MGRQNQTRDAQEYVVGLRNVISIPLTSVLPRVPELIPCPFVYNIQNLLHLGLLTTTVVCAKSVIYQRYCIAEDLFPGCHA